MVWRAPGYCEIPNILGNAYLQPLTPEPPKEPKKKASEPTRVLQNDKLQRERTINPMLNFVFIFSAPMDTSSLDSRLDACTTRARSQTRRSSFCKAFEEGHDQIGHH